MNSQELRKKYDSQIHTHNQTKTLPFDDLNATRMFLREEKIRSILFPFQHSWLLQWCYKADGALTTKSQGAD